MAKPNYTRINTPVVTAVYPHLTEPDTKFDPEGVYRTKFSLPADEAADLIAKLEGIRDAFAEEQDAKIRKTYTIADVCEVELDDEGDETGNVIFTAKMKAKVTTKAGKTFEQAPALFDSANNRLETDGLKLWGGSKLRINADVVPYAMASSKQIGVSLRLKAVQIVELVSGGGGSPFDEYEGGDVIENSGGDTEENPFDGEDGDADDY